MLSEEQLHIETVKAEAQRKQEVKEEKERQLAVKMEEKRKRREAKEAKKRAEERANLRAEIEAQFIAKGTQLEPIVAQEILEMDGGPEAAGKAVVGAVGGVLGQLIVVLSILEKNFNRQMTSKSKQSKKSSKSGKSGSKKVDEEAKKQADEDAKSGLGEASKTDRDGAATPDQTGAGGEGGPSAEPVVKEKGWFTKQNIQNFLHHFIGERMKTEKLHLTVGAAY